MAQHGTVPHRGVRQAAGRRGRGVRPGHAAAGPAAGSRDATPQRRPARRRARVASGVVTARTYVLCHAHPDDETLSTGAIALGLRARGDAVVVLTATRGELGDVRPCLLYTSP